MIYKDFGRTGKKVSALGMGVSRFQPEEYNTAAGMERCAEIIAKAWEYGINYFDVAPTYCGWRAEEMLGMAIFIYTGSHCGRIEEEAGSFLKKAGPGKNNIL